MKQKKIYLGLSALLFFCVTYTHQKHFDSATPVSRLDLFHALFVQGTVRINSYHENTPDKAVLGNNYFSDKAPGTAALALVPFAFAATVLSLAGIGLDSNFGWLFSSWVACAGSIGLVTALGGAALFAWLSNHVPPRSALVTTLALFLGAAPLPYATMMFSHALVVGLLAIAIWAIGMQAEASRQGKVQADPVALNLSASETERETRQARIRFLRWFTTNRWELLAGFACGWVLASEYSAGLVVAGLFLWLVSTNWKRVVPFCVAAIPPLLLIPAYSWVCFDDPFTLPYTHQASFPAMKEGLYAIKWPDAETAFNLLFSSARGLFFWTPFFVMAGFGYRKLFHLSPRLLWLTYALPLLQIAVISGRVWDWPAGPAWGPRLLSPMIPLLALPCAFGMWRFPNIGIVLAVYSIEITTLATVTDACPNFGSHPNPLLDLNLPLFLEGEFSPNLGLVLGLRPCVSIALYYGVIIGATCWLWRKLPETGEKVDLQAGKSQDVHKVQND